MCRSCEVHVRGEIGILLSRGWRVKNSKKEGIQPHKNWGICIGKIFSHREGALDPLPLDLPSDFGPALIWFSF